MNFATFNVNISEVVRVEEKPGQADSLGARMSAGFRSGLEDLKDGAEDFMVWVSYNVVGLAVFAVAVIVVVTVIRRKKVYVPFGGRGKKSPNNKE